MKERVRTREIGVQTAHDAHADINQTSKIGLGIVVSFAGLVGAWGLACMLGALTSQGIGGVIRGFFSAVTGM